jgi:DNA-binding CsgD family transcriptional regulator
VIAELHALAPPAAAGPRAGDRSAIRLSPREREVLVLLAAGHTDRAIAAALFVSVRTVEGHVARILAKLGAPTRGAAVTTAVATGLVVPRASAPLPAEGADRQIKYSSESE